MKQVNIKCPYCNSQALLRPASAVHGFEYRQPGEEVYVCARYPACDSYVSAHRRTHLPMGTLANRPLRIKRMKAHNAFNRLWQSGMMTRTDAYHWLQVQLVVFLVTEDQVLLIISMLLALFTAVRCMSLYRRIATGEYETIEGICIRIKNAPLCKQRSISLLAEDGAEQTILLDKQTKVRMGNCYRVYFGSVSDSHTYLEQDSFLALEDLGEFQAGDEKDF